MPSKCPLGHHLGDFLSFNLSLHPVTLVLIACAFWLQLLISRKSTKPLKMHVLFQEGNQHFSLKKKMHACSFMFKLIIWSLENLNKQEQFCCYYRDSYTTSIHMVKNFPLNGDSLKCSTHFALSDID
jgi:hypothetical protein